MAVDAFPFGSSTAQNEYGAAIPIVLLVWEPFEPPRPIPPGALDVVTTVENRVLFQYSRDPNWQKLAAFIGEQFAALNDSLATLYPSRELASVCGDALDLLGWQVGLARGGLGCAAYRAAIRVRGASLDSSGTIPEILEIVIGLFGAATYVPWYPAAFSLIVPSITADGADLLVALLADPIPAGVGLTLIVGSPALAPGWGYTGAVNTWANRWTYSGGADGSENSTHGFAISVG